VTHVTSKDGTAIAFDRVGEGPALILVGGAFQHRAIDPRTAHLAELLAPDFTVFHYDRRGRGESGDTAPYAVEHEVEDLEALIAEAGGAAYVYGMSSGAALALEAAAHGLAIMRLALYEPPYIVDDTRPRPPENLGPRYTELSSAGRRGEAVELFMTMAVGIPAEVVAQMRHAPMWPALEGVAHTLAYDAAIMGDGSVPVERLASVTVPTLVIDGAKSEDFLQNGARAVAAALPNAQHRSLAGQAHDVAADALAPELAGFFTGGKAYSRLQASGGNERS
jgi:pimeloyl-ACP methyl ester carboxylesterase